MKKYDWFKNSIRLTWCIIVAITLPFGLNATAQEAVKTNVKEQPDSRMEVFYNIEDAGVLNNRLHTLREGYSELCITENIDEKCLLLDVWKLHESFYVAFYTSNQSSYEYFK